MGDTKSIGVAFRDQNLDGSTIENSVIGATTPAAATFTTMTSTTAVVGGSTLSGTELGYVDGITPGTVEADKAIVPTTDKHIDALVISDGGLALGSGAGTAISATAAELNYNDVTTLGTAQASKTLTTDANKMLAWTVSSATVGNVEPFTLGTTLTGAGATGGRVKFSLDTDVALGGWSNALKGIVTYGANGSTSGLGSAVVGELVMSAGTTGGTYAPIESEITLGSGAAVGTATSFLYGNVTDDSATFNTNGYFFELGGGVVDTSGGLYDQVTEQVATAQARLKVRIGGTTWYIPLCDTTSLA
jgi:hypothetical protein